MKKLYLVARAAGSRFAIPADLVRTVVQSGTIVPVPLADDRIAGLSTLRSRVITVIDTAAAINDGRASVAEEMSIVVTEVATHDYGLAVEEVEDVIELEPAREAAEIAFDNRWAPVATGFVEVAGKAVIVIDPEKLIGRCQRRAA